MAGQEAGEKRETRARTGELFEVVGITKSLS